MTRSTARLWLVFLALVALSAARGVLLPDIAELSVGAIRPPPDCAVGTFEVCSSVDAATCHYERHFSCEAGQPAYRRIYRDPLAE